ncbi:Fic family protein [Candidatus Micrarchaeota archaeon]|nr:Fic family protein [Candidatus Micrarchaeota archaeon]
MTFVRKRSKGNTYYYELVESRREGGKVRQNVLKYFPSAHEAESYAKGAGIEFRMAQENWIDSTLAQRLEDKLRKLNSLRPLPQEMLKRLREKFEVDMTYNSNAIEGNRLNLRETWLVLRKGMTIRGKSMVEHLEATNHLEALSLLEKMANRKKEVVEADVLSLHAAVLDKIDSPNAGFYRHEQVYIQGSKLTLPNWRKVPEMMKTVFGEFKARKTRIEAVYSAVKIHYETVRIHPFVDGNGRLARLLMNLRLMRAGFPPMVLRREERRAYYSALEKADKGDFRPISMLVAKDVEAALDLYLDSVA